MTCGGGSGGDGCGDQLGFSVTDNPWVIVYELSLDGQPVDLTGLSMLLTFKNSPQDADADAVLVITFPVPAGDDAENGLVSVVINSDERTALVPGTYFLKSATTDGGDPAIVQSYGDPVQFEVSE